MTEQRGPSKFIIAVTGRRKAFFHEANERIRKAGSGLVNCGKAEATIGDSVFLHVGYEPHDTRRVRGVRFDGHEHWDSWEFGPDTDLTDVIASQIRSKP